MNTKEKILISFISVLVGFLIGAIILTITGYGFLTIFTSLIEGTIMSKLNFTTWLMQTSILILTGLSVAFAYRAGIFNIGAEGQFIAGGFTSVLISLYAPLPGYSLVLVSCVAGIIAGGIYGLIAGFLKAKFNVSEVVSTIMLNWIIFKYVNYLIQTYFHGENPVKTAIIPNNGSLRIPYLSDFFGGTFHLGIFIAILGVILFWFIFEKTKFGYEIKMVGFNPYAAKFSGVNDKNKIMQTMFISGAFAGAAGTIYAIGSMNSYSATTIFLNYGFDGITIAFLGQMNAIGMIFSGLLLGGLRTAGTLMNGVPKEIIDIIVGNILLTSITGPIIYNKIKVKKTNKKEV